MRRTAALVSLAVLVAGLAAIGIRYFLRDRTYLSVTPQPPTVEVPVTLPVPGHGHVCMNLAALDRRSEVALLQPTGAKGRPVPLALAIDGEGYHARARVAADYRNGQTVAVPVRPPDRSVTTTICVRDLSARAVTFPAVIDRRRSRSAVLVNGKPVAPGFVIRFRERDPVSIAQRLPDSMRRMSVFRPGAISPAVLWVLLAVAIAGVPALAVWGYGRAVRSEPPPAEDAQEPA